MESEVVWLEGLNPRHSIYGSFVHKFWSYTLKIHNLQAILTKIVK